MRRAQCIAFVAAFAACTGPGVKARDAGRDQSAIAAERRLLDSARPDTSNDVSLVGNPTIWLATGASEHGEEVESCMLDSDGAAYVGGDFEGVATWGATLVSRGDRDGFVIKFDQNGVPLWSSSFGSTRKDLGARVAIDANSNVYVSGWIGGDTAFGSTVVQGSSSSFVPTTRYLAKMDSAGIFLWATASDALSSTWGGGMGVAADGSVRVAGTFNGTLTWSTTTLNSMSSEDECFIAHFSSSGALLWAVAAGSGSCHDLALDPVGNSYVSGKANAIFAFGNLKTGAGHFLLTLGPQAQPLALSGGWQGAFHPSLRLAATPSGAALAGTFDTQASLEGHALSAIGGTDLAVIRSNTVVEWARSAGGPGNDFVGGIATDKEGSIYVTGSFGALGAGSATFAPYTVTSVGGSIDVFVVKYGSDGGVRWVVTAGGDGVDGGQCVAVDAAGDVLVAGTFLSNTATFGTRKVTRTGMSDAFVWKFRQPMK